MKSEKKASMENSAQKIKENFRRDDLVLALHMWTPERPKAILFYVNGLQSHAAWISPIADFLSSRNIAVFVLDRRGTGESEGLKGDIPSADILLEDYYQALAYVRNKYPQIPLTLFGQSMGGSILAALLSREGFDIQYDAIIFSASALGRRRQQLSPYEYKETLNNRSISYVDIHLRDEDYTDDKKYLDFMKNDPHGFKQITARSKAAMIDIENRYYDKKNITGNAVSCYVYPMFDPIVNIQSALKLFMQLTGNNGLSIQFPVDKHYLWFTKSCLTMMHWLESFVLSAGYRR